jgi:hypothetical protein
MLSALGLGQPFLMIDWFVLDIILGFEPWLSTENACTFPCNYVHCEATPSPKKELFSIPNFSAKRPNQRTQFAQSDYVGVYVHPAYGRIEITAATNSQVGYSFAHLMLSPRNSW